MKTTEIIQLASSKGLDVLEDSIKINDSGIDFLVAHAREQNGEKWILRIPRRPESMRNARQEKEALEIIGRNTSFQVPRWSVFSEELIAYKQLSGVPAGIIDLEKQCYIWSLDEKNLPSEYYSSLGKVLAELHSLAQDEFRIIKMEILGSDELRASMKRRMERVKEKYQINPGLWERWQAWLAEDSLWPAHVGVKHGDLHPGHILINRHNYVTGLIDWTEIGISDVSVDFTAHFLLFGEDGLKRLLNEYDNAGGKTWTKMPEHIAELATTTGITVAEYAQVSGLKEMHDTATYLLALDQ